MGVEGEAWEVLHGFILNRKYARVYVRKWRSGPAVFLTQLRRYPGGVPVKLI